MADLLHFLTLSGLADVGRDSISALWLPLAAWTVCTLLGEGLLRVARPHPMVAVRVRSALLLGLPLALLAPPAFAALVPDAAHAVAAYRPEPFALPEIVTVARPEATVMAPPPGWVALGLATVAVLLASAIGVVRWALALFRLRRIQTSLAPASEGTQALLDQTGRRLGLRRPIQAALCDERTAPFTFGWRRPVVAVPSSLTGEPLRLALAHELAHVRHRDFLWNAIEQGIAALGTAHPLVHLLTRQAALGREEAADALVLADFPSQRRAYADLLFSYASLPAPGLTLGATQGSSALQTRITAMTRTFTPARLRQLATAGRAFGLLAMLLLVGATVGLVVPDAAAALTPPEWLEGRVTDATTQEGIPAANLAVTIEDTTIGAGTGPDGTYRLLRPEGAFTLRISAAGYIPFTVEVGPEQSQLDAALRPSEDRDRIVGPPMPLGPPAPDIFEVVENPPRLIGGLEELQNRVVYPEKAIAQGIAGRVFVTFVVNEQGRVQDARVARTPDPMLSEAALAAVQASEFEPGLQRGQAVKVRYSLPVNFRLPRGNRGDGQDRGANEPAEGGSGTVQYAGVDLTVLENEPLIRHLIESVPSDMMDRRGATGTAEVRYVLQPDGSFSEVEVVSAPRDGELARLTKGIAERMILAENRRPPTSRTGMFRLDYR